MNSYPCARAISDDVNEELAQCVLDKALSMMSDGDDHGNHDDHGCLTPWRPR